MVKRVGQSLSLRQHKFIRAEAPCSRGIRPSERDVKTYLSLHFRRSNLVTVCAIMLSKASWKLLIPRDRQRSFSSPYGINPIGNFIFFLKI